MLTARTRIALGLTSTVVSVVLIAMNVGIIPDYRDVAMRGRAQICEAIAANSSLIIRQRDLRRMQAILQMMAERNSDIQTAGIRRADGTLTVEIGNHGEVWQATEDGQSTPTQVSVPIRTAHAPWGSVELTFRPFVQSGWRGFFTNPQLLYVGFIGSVTYLLASIYLRKTLQHVDPSKVVPGRVRSALDTLAEGLLVLDHNYRVMLANQSFAEIVGEAPERLVGRNAADLPWAISPNANETEYPWETSFKSETPLTGMMIRLVDHDGKKRSFMVNCTPIPGNDGKVRGVLASLEDVTQLEETQYALSRSKEAADAANQAKSEFLARMSHEIRTPMNAILGFTDVLRRGFETNELERREYLDTIHASGQHLLNLINDILDLSKVEAGRLDIERIRCSPLQLIHEVVTVLRGQAERKGLALTYETPTGLPEYILTDPVRFRQLLTNLIGNAVKFTECGGVRVVARVVHTQDPWWLVVDVIDTGIGIPEGTRDKVFDPFVQADTSVTRKFGGTGLGLAISRRFAEALGGELTVESELGTGSTFTFTLDPGPLEGVRIIQASIVQASEIKQTPQHSVSTIANTIAGQLPGARILVVDDGDSNRKLISLVLGRAGAIVQGARHGKEAIDVLSRTSVDLVLMDMQMPVMDGYTAARLLRETGFQAPIIALTADAMKGTEGKCLDAGCTGFLTKPIDMDKLVGALAEVLQAHGYTVHPAGSMAPELAATTAAGEPIHSTLPTDDSDFCEIIAEFAQRLREKIAAMRTAAANRQLDSLVQLAHWLKGSGGTAGFPDFTNPAAELLHLARSGANDHQIAAPLEQIEEIAQRLVVPAVPACAPE